MAEFDVWQSLRRLPLVAALLIGLTGLLWWLGWHVPDIAFSDFGGGFARAEVVHYEASPANPSERPWALLRYRDESGATLEQRADVYDEDRGLDLRPGAQHWIWYRADNPNLTQFTPEHGTLLLVFFLLGLPSLLAGLAVLAWTTRHYLRRRWLLQHGLRLGIQMPRMEAAPEFGALRSAPGLRRWRLLARVFSDGQWRDVRSSYVITHDHVQIPEGQLPPLLMHPRRPSQYWLPIPVEWIGPVSFWLEVPRRRV